MGITPEQLPLSFRKPRSGCPESILPIVVMDSGPAPNGASRNDGTWWSTRGPYPDLLLLVFCTRLP